MAANPARWVPVGKPIRLNNVKVDGKRIGLSCSLQQMQPAGSPPPKYARPLSYGALKR